MGLGSVAMVRRIAVVIAVGLALALPTAAAAKVRLVSVSSPINHGAYATLTVSVSRSATCSITVYYKSGPSEAAGLYPKRGSRISWTWKVGTRTTPGRWPVTVTCGSAGTLQTSFVVT
jgi:hypothetical protein